MALVVPEIGLAIQANIYLTEWNTNSLRIHLYKNNYSPVQGSVLGDFTEADYSGYASQLISTWTGPSWVAPRQVLEAGSSKTFSNTTGAVGNTVYGYYITDQGGNLVWAERDPSAPIDMGSAGRTYIILPRYSVRSEF